MTCVDAMRCICRGNLELTMEMSMDFPAHCKLLQKKSSTVREIAEVRRGSRGGSEGVGGGEVWVKGVIGNNK